MHRSTPAPPAALLLAASLCLARQELLLSPSCARGVSATAVTGPTHASPGYRGMGAGGFHAVVPLCLLPGLAVPLVTVQEPLLCPFRLSAHISLQSVLWLSLHQQCFPQWLLLSLCPAGQEI